jgi:hypothetical protein
MAEKILPGNVIMLHGAIGLNQQMLPVFLGLMLAAAIAWLFTSNRLYAELRQHYPNLYKTLGTPKFVMKNSFAINVKVIRFLFKQDSTSSLDPEVMRMCQGLRFLLYIYLVSLGGCLVLLLDKFS